MIHDAVGADDPRITAYAHVGDHTWLAHRGLFVAEGRLIVERLVASGRYDIESALVTLAAFEALRTTFEALESDVYIASQSVLNAVTGFNFHRGCLALARRPPLPPLDRFIEGRRLLVVEGVGNPDNLGGLFRAAAALGGDGILLDASSGDPWYRKAIRTSMGAVLRVPFTRVDEVCGAVRRLRDGGLRVIALTPDESARALADVSAALPHEVRVALLVGGEGAGLSAGALAAADERVRIPMTAGVDSLNVAVAAAIALYALNGGQRSAGL